MEDPSTGVLVWWMALAIVSVWNIGLWVWVARSVTRTRPGEARSLDGRTRAHLALSAVFTAGCAFRSFLPRAEAQRICLVDTWISSAAIARTVATFAELSLV